MFRHLPPMAPHLTGKDFVAGVRTSFAGATAVEAFAASVAQYAGVRAAFLASSGRSALYLLLKGLAKRAPTRCEVVLPAYTCPSLVKVVQEARLETRLCDISPWTLDFDMDQLHKLVGERTLAVIPVHLFGIPQAVQEIIALADEMGATVIEDAAQAMGARLHGRMAGAWGHFGLISLGPGKALSTGGGGAILTNDDERCEVLAQIWQRLPARSCAASIRALVQLGALTVAFRPSIWWLVAKLGIDRAGGMESTWGFRVRGLSAAQAGVGQSLLRQLDAVSAARRSQAANLMAALNDAQAVRFLKVAEGAEPVYVRLPLLISGRGRRDRLHAALRGQGIGAGKMYRQPLSAIFPELAGSHYHGATVVAAELLTLPTHRFVTPGDVARITSIIHQLN